MFQFLNFCVISTLFLCSFELSFSLTGQIQAFTRRKDMKVKLVALKGSFSETVAMMSHNKRFQIKKIFFFNSWKQPMKSSIVERIMVYLYIMHSYSFNLMQILEYNTCKSLIEMFILIFITKNNLKNNYQIRFFLKIYQNLSFVLRCSYIFLSVMHIFYPLFENCLKLLSTWCGKIVMVSI